MDIVSIIEKKANNEELSKSELEFAVISYVDGSIPDYQISALLMAIKLNGMTDKEIFELTDIMIKSGDTLDFDFNIVDKHSSGGVGDKTTLVLIPLVAYLGTKVFKMSGRGLGHTGGTIDKLESIPGFKTSISEDDALKQVKNIGACITSQTGNLCPADKKIYALRDVTGTVKSIPLIASSIMSKKIAGGAKNIVIDLKVGSGALMNNIEDARELASLMIKIGKFYGRKVIVVLTNMNIPLGRAVGNAVEVVEAIDTLKGNGPKDLEELVINLAAIMLSMDQNIPMEILIESVENALKSGEAYHKFEEIVKAQGGDINNIKISENVSFVKAEMGGYINEIDTLKIGKLSGRLGAGRIKEDDEIDHSVGIVLEKTKGDRVEIGDVLARVYTGKTIIPLRDVLDCFVIDESRVEAEPLIYEIMK